MVDQVDSRYDAVSRSLAKARNDAIFLNLVRASHDYPLAFTAIANVTPGMTNTSSFALPSFSLGPPNCLPGLSGVTHSIACSFPTGVPGAPIGFGNTTASNSTAVSSNFNISTEETGSFYQGFLKPIELPTLDYFIRQGYPRELLFWLFADSFQLQFGNNPRNAIGYQYDPPVSYGCPQEQFPHLPQLCFREWVWIAVLSGLTVEEKTIVKASGGAKGGRDSSSGAAKGPETTIVARFCFSPQLQRQAANLMGNESAAQITKLYFPINQNQISPWCGTWSDAAAKAQAEQPQDDTFKFKLGLYTFRIVPRSAYGVFEFLGNLMKMQRENREPAENAYLPPRHDMFAPIIEMPPTLLTANKEQLITVLQNSGANCFSQTWFIDGQYCVPEEATNTKKIFSLLAQLIAIETSATDLSITPIVRIIQ